MSSDQHLNSTEFDRINDFNLLGSSTDPTGGTVSQALHLIEPAELLSGNDLDASGHASLVTWDDFLNLEDTSDASMETPGSPSAPARALKFYMEPEYWNEDGAWNTYFPMTAWATEALLLDSNIGGHNHQKDPIHDGTTNLGDTVLSFDEGHSPQEYVIFMCPPLIYCTNCCS